MCSIRSSAVMRPPIAMFLRYIVANIRHLGSIMASVWASSRLNRSQYVQRRPVHECGGMSKSMSPIVSNSAGCSFIVPLFVLVASVLSDRATRNAATRRHPRLSYGRGLRLPVRWYVRRPIFMIRWRTVKHFHGFGVLGMISGLHLCEVNSR
jgi:hypothetical protein